MTTALPERTFADLLEDLGDISANRILLSPPPGMASEDDVLRLLDGANKQLCELIDGTLVEKAMGLRESLLAGSLCDALRNFVRPRNLGIVTPADGTIRLWAGRVRIPDVAFFSWGRLPERKIPREPIPELSPDVAVEVLSIGNTPREMELKRHDYFRSGVTVYWEIDPRARTIAVHSSPDDRTILTSNDTLDGGSVLPGFSLQVSDLFAELDEHG